MGLEYHMKAGASDNSEQRIIDDEAEKRVQDQHRENERRRQAEEAIEDKDAKQAFLAEQKRKREKYEREAQERRNRRNRKKEQENSKKSKGNEKAKSAEKAGEKASKAEKVAERASKAEKAAESATKSSRIAKAEGTLSKISRYAKSSKTAVTSAAEKIGMKVGQSAAGRLAMSTAGKTALRWAGSGALRVLGATLLQPVGAALLALDIGWSAYQWYSENKAEKAKVAEHGHQEHEESKEDMLSILEAHQDRREAETLKKLDDHIATAPYVNEYSKKALNDPEEKARLTQRIEDRIKAEEPAGAHLAEGQVDAELKKLIAVYGGNELEGKTKHSTIEVDVMGLDQANADVDFQKTMEALDQVRPSYSSADVPKVLDELSKTNSNTIFKTKEAGNDPAFAKTIQGLEELDSKHAAASPSKGMSL